MPIFLPTFDGRPFDILSRFKGSTMSAALISPRLTVLCCSTRRWPFFSKCLFLAPQPCKITFYRPVLIVSPVDWQLGGGGPLRQRPSQQRQQYWSTVVWACTVVRQGVENSSSPIPLCYLHVYTTTTQPQQHHGGKQQHHDGQPHHGGD